MERNWKFDNLELFLEHLTLREPGVQIYNITYLKNRAKQSHMF